MLHNHILDSDYARYTARERNDASTAVCASVDTRVCRRARSEMRRELGLPSPAGAETDKKTHQSARRGTGVTRAASRTPTSGWWILVRTNRRLSEDQGRGMVVLFSTCCLKVDQVTSCHCCISRQRFSGSPNPRHEARVLALAGPAQASSSSEGPPARFVVPQSERVCAYRQPTRPLRGTEPTKGGRVSPACGD